MFFRSLVHCKSSYTNSLVHVVESERTELTISSKMKSNRFRECISECRILDNDETIVTFRGGNILLVDLGRMTFKSELQAVDVQLEDATLMELEELLYDRIHLVWTDAQVLISHSGSNFFQYALFFNRNPSKTHHRCENC